MKYLKVKISSYLPIKFSLNCFAKFEIILRAEFTPTPQLTVLPVNEVQYLLPEQWLIRSDRSYSEDRSASRKPAALQPAQVQGVAFVFGIWSAAAAPVLALNWGSSLTVQKPVDTLS